MIRVIIFGAGGYTGEELLRWLARHPSIEIVGIVARSLVGRKVKEVYRDIDLDTVFIDTDEATSIQSDVVFFATPHAVAHQYAQLFLEKGAKIIDLSADFRLRDVSIWQQYYETKHQAASLIPKAVYGLAEYYKSSIMNADLIACPGCYPTSIILAMLPILQEGFMPDVITAISVSGISGAGRNVAEGDLQESIQDNFYSYKVDRHRHYREITQVLSDIAQKPIDVCFVPQLAPLSRGMHSTISVQKNSSVSVDIQQLYESYYRDYSFISVLPSGSCPQTKDVVCTNNAHIAVYDKGSHYIILSVIDNLAKGASTQAIQNMNLCFGLDETLGLINA